MPLPHLAPLLSLAGLDRYGNRDAAYLQVQPNGAITDGLSLLNAVKGAGWVLPGYSQCVLWCPFCCHVHARERKGVVAAGLHGGAVACLPLT